MKKTILKNLGFVKAGEYRKNVILVLKDEFLCPTEIAEKIKYPTSHVSNTLSELAKRDLVTCVNPEVRKGKLYTLTSSGKKICCMLKSK